MFPVLLTGTMATAVAVVPIIRKWNQYIGIQNGSYLVAFGMVLKYHSKSEPFNIRELSSIQNQNLFGIRAPTVQCFCASVIESLLQLVSSYLRI